MAYPWRTDIAVLNCHYLGFGCIDVKGGSQVFAGL